MKSISFSIHVLMLRHSKYLQDILDFVVSSRQLSMLILTESDVLCIHHNKIIKTYPVSFIYILSWWKKLEVFLTISKTIVSII